MTTPALATVNVCALVEPDTTQLTTAEIAAIRNFMASGGCLLLLTHTSVADTAINALLAGSGIAQDINLAGATGPTTDLTSHPITSAVSAFYVALGTKTFATSPTAVSCVRYNGSTIVAAADMGSHRIVAVGDESALRDSYLTNNDNKVLARNIFNWFRQLGFRGVLSLDSAVYPTSAVVTVELQDNDLRAATTATVEARSTTGDRETVVLKTHGPGHFAGSLPLRNEAATVGNGRLAVSDGSVIAVIYSDANVGSGTAADIQTTAVVDGRPPTIWQVETVRVGPFSARVSWLTDEPCSALVRFGRTLAATTGVVTRGDLRTTHVLELRWLDPSTTYVFVVESRDRASNLAIANNDGIGFDLTTGPSRRTSPFIDVLLLYSDTRPAGVDDIASKILSDGRVARVDRWDYNTQLPTSTVLGAYDAVLLHVNLVSVNGVGLGDTLADFVASGGPIVSLNRATVDPVAVGGRFRSNGYGVFAPSSSYRVNQRATLGALYDPAHPLLDDVERFDGGAWSGHQWAVALTTGSVRIADWSDGEPLVAHKSANGARLVGLNFFGPSSDTAGGTGLWDSATDGARLIANALVWASRALESDACATPCLVAEPAFTRGTTNTIAWEPFTVAEQVEIEWSQDGFASVVGRSGWIAESLRRWTVSGLANGRAYSYRMRGRSGPLSLSPYSNVVSSTQDASPPYSYVLALPPYRPATFSVSWTGSDELSGLASVRLFYRRGSTGPFVAYGGEHTKTPILFDATETGGSGDYYFYTIATDAVGNQESAPSGWDAHTTVQTEPPASPQLASEPLFTSGTTNRLSWNAVGEAAEYSLQWSEDSQFKSLAGSSGWTTTTVFAAAGLLDGHKYYYRIKSRNRALLESAWSASVSSTQDASPPQTSIGALPTTTSAAAIALSVSGSDVGSGLRSADLLWRRGSAGSFKQVAQFSTLPQEYSFYPAEHEGAGAHEFMVRGADKVGNTESKSLPDARTQVIWTGAAARSWEEYDR